MGSECSAKHHSGFRKAPGGIKPCKKRPRIQHRGHAAVLIDPAYAVLDHPGTQHQPVPMWSNFVISPEMRSDWLVAHLLRYSDPVFLDFAVGMIRADAHPDAPCMAQEQKLHLAARMLPRGLDRGL